MTTIRRLQALASSGFTEGEAIKLLEDAGYTVTKRSGGILRGLSAKHPHGKSWTFDSDRGMYDREEIEDAVKEAGYFTRKALRKRK